MVHDDTEKLTLNVVAHDLGRIDLLVTQGLYSSRSDFFRTATRRQLEAHGDVIDSVLARDKWFVGYAHCSRAWFETQEGPVSLSVLGSLRIDDDVDPELADHVLQSLRIRGILRGPAEVLARLAPKTDRGIRVQRGN